MLYVVCWAFAVGHLWSCDPPTWDRIAAIQNFRRDVEVGLQASISEARTANEALEQVTRYRAHVAE
jgi:hypothetical protein